MAVPVQVTFRDIPTSDALTAHVEKRAAVNERVTVFSVTALSKQSLMPAFNRCKPPREGSRATQDVDALAKRYQETFIEPLSAAGKTVVIPPKSNRRSPRTYDRDLYKARHLIENFFARLKQFRAIATRYDKAARNFLAAIYLAASVVWLN